MGEALQFLTHPPVMMLAGFALFVVALMLLMCGSRRLLLFGILGFVAGYFAFGIPLADHFAEDAQRRGACGDAAWGGPAAGGLIGTGIAALAFVITRLTRAGRPQRLA